jgi:kynurenine formamidase
MSEIIRLSHILTADTPSYGNRDRFFVRQNSAVKSGGTANSSCWIFSNNHIGTHIDVPRHFSDGGLAVNDFPVSDWFFSNVALADIPCTAAKLIDAADFSDKTIDKNIDLLLIRTGFEAFRGEDRYWNDNPGLSPELPRFFRENFPALRCVGFDFISITSWTYRAEGRQAHRNFLCPENNENPILAIEDMSLKNLLKTPQQVVVAPLLVEDGNGGAVTVFAKI